MTSPVHVVVVARAGKHSRADLSRTIASLKAQKTAPDWVTVVICGSAEHLLADEAASEISAVKIAPATANFSQAVRLGFAGSSPAAMLWMLPAGSAADPDCLAELIGELERSPSALTAAPKQLERLEPSRIRSFGVSMTGLGRSVELVSDERDQGQHDRPGDVLGAHVWGMLLRDQSALQLLPDPGLDGVDEGLDIGVRARLMGGRTVLAPGARLFLAPRRETPQGTDPDRSAYRSRRGQLHRRLSYAPALALPLHWILLLPLALVRSLGQLLDKRPGKILPEWGAAAVSMVLLSSVIRSRRQIGPRRRSAWQSIKPLRIGRQQLSRQMGNAGEAESSSYSELRFFAGGGGWAVLAAVLLSAVALTPILTWPSLAGGALLPLRDSVLAGWQDAGWGIRQVGLEVVGPADPFAALLALLGSLWPAQPTMVMIVLWFAAIPVAVLGGWFAATRISDRAGVRVFVGAVWALSPTFLVALTQGRPAAVMVHLILPWLLYAGAAAHRSLGAASASALLLVAVVAAAPVLAVPLVLVVLIAALGMALQRQVLGMLRLVWVLIPSALVAIPLATYQIIHGSAWALLADPGAVTAGTQLAPDAAGRFVLALGFPDSGFAGWEQIIGSLAIWVPLLIAPLLAIAIGAAFSTRWAVGIGALIIMIAGGATALAAIGISVSFTQGQAVSIWPGSALSLAWLGLVSAAAVSLDTVVRRPRLQVGVMSLAGLALLVLAVPALTAQYRPAPDLQAGSASTLPAYVAAEARGDTQTKTLVITALGNDAVATQVVWGSSNTLNAQSTMLTTATNLVGRSVADLSVELLVVGLPDGADQLADLGIGYVLLAPPSIANALAETERQAGIVAMDQRPGFVRVGDTAKGALWRLGQEPVTANSLTPIQQQTAILVNTGSVMLVAIVILLALPTRSSRRAARSKSRVVGLTRAERLRDELEASYQVRRGGLTGSGNAEALSEEAIGDRAVESDLSAVGQDLQSLTGADSISQQSGSALVHPPAVSGRTVLNPAVLNPAESDVAESDGDNHGAAGGGFDEIDDRTIRVVRRIDDSDAPEEKV